MSERSTPDIRSGARIGEVAAVAFSLAVIAGAIEVVVAFYKQFALQRIVMLSYDYPWMIPASFLLIVLPATLILYLVLVVVRRPPALSTVTGFLIGVLVLSMLLPYAVIAWWGSTLLAAGTGMQAARLAARARSTSWVRRLRVAATLIAVALIVTGVAVRAERLIAERRTMAALPSPPKSPNVLLVVLDTVRAANLSLYGYERATTPYLVTLATESTVFDYAMATSSWTLPTHASLFTGLSSDAVGVGWRTRLSDDHRTVSEVFSKHGYATGGFAANLGYTSYESGLSRGFARYSDYQPSLLSLYLHSSLAHVDVRSRVPDARTVGAAWDALWASDLRSRFHPPADLLRRAPEVAADFLEWQAGLEGRPFFAFLNLFDAHEADSAREDQVRKLVGNGPVRRIDRYDAAIVTLDEVVGSLMNTLKARGVLDNTIVVITSDHGEHFNDHGLLGHANSLYLSALHVPLIIRYPPGVPMGRRVGTAVSLRDVSATLLDQAGISDSGFPGRSLAVCSGASEAGVCGDVNAYLEMGSNVDPSFPNAAGPMASSFSERLHYIRDGRGQEALYDYRKDPQELNNLVQSPELQGELSRLRQQVGRK